MQVFIVSSATGFVGDTKGMVVTEEFPIDYQHPIACRSICERVCCKACTMKTWQFLPARMSHTRPYNVLVQDKAT